MPAYSPVPVGPPAVGGFSPAPDTPAAGETRVLQVLVQGSRGQGLPDKKIPKLKTRIGEPYDPQAIEDDVRTLVKSKKFIEVLPKVQPVNGGVIVTFQVVERPIITKIIIVGNEHTMKGTLLGKCELKVKDPLDYYAINEGRNKIEAYYHDEGYDRVHVQVLQGESSGEVVYKVDEGRKRKIWETSFNGEHFETGSRLSTQIGSNPPIVYTKFFWGGFNGYADLKKMDEDDEKLTRYYHAFGYFQCHVSHYVRPEDDDRWVYVTFYVDEGPRYKVSNVSFIGEQTFGPTRLSDGLKLHAGDYYNQGAMEKDRGKIADLYGSYGFVYADVGAEPRLSDEAAELDMVYNIKEGKRYRVGKVNVSITGESPHTSYVTILERLSLRPGDILDTTKIRKDVVRLQRSGLYAHEPNKMPKINLGKPPGMDDPDKQLAERDHRPGWLGGPSSSGESGSSSHPFGPAFGSSSGDSLDGSGSASGGSSFRGQAPDYDAPPIETVDIDYASREPDPQQPQAPQQPPHAPKPGEWVEWVDPLSPTSVPPEEMIDGFNGPKLSPGKAPQTSAPARIVPTAIAPAANVPARTNAPPAPQTNSEENGLIIRGQEPAFGGYAPGATGPDSASGPSFGPIPQNAAPQSAVPQGAAPQYSMPQNPAPVQVAQAPYSYPPSSSVPNYGSPPNYSAPVAAAPYVPPQPSYVQGPYVPSPAASYPPQSYPQYGAPPTGATPPPFNTPVPGSTQAGGTVGYYQLPGGAAEPVPSPAAIGQIRTDPYGLPYLDINPDAIETQTGKLSIGVGVNSDAGLVGSIVIDEQNFDLFRPASSWEDVRDGTAFRGGGDQLKIELAPGVEVQNYVISLTQPYLFGEPIALSNSIAYFERFYDNWTDTRVAYNMSVGYYFTPDLLGKIGYNVERVRISAPTVPTPPEVQNALGWSFENGPSLSLQHDTRDDPFLPGQGHLIRYNFQYDFGRFDYAINRLDLRQYYTLAERPDGSGKQVLGLGTSIAFAGRDTPVFDTFYAGGFSSLRGFAFRGVSPLDEGVAVGGDFEWLNTIEYNFPITADDVVRGVAFVDFGDVETNVDQFEAKDIRVAPGVGLRIKIPALGAAPIALDFAAPLNRLPGDQGQIFSFSLGYAR
jgi:outer membrane protein insertion porin family